DWHEHTTIGVSSADLAAICASSRADRLLSAILTGERPLHFQPPNRFLHLRTRELRYSSSREHTHAVEEHLLVSAVGHGPGRDSCIARAGYPQRHRAPLPASVRRAHCAAFR